MNNTFAQNKKNHFKLSKSDIIMFIITFFLAFFTVLFFCSQSKNSNLPHIDLSKNRQQNKYSLVTDNDDSINTTENNNEQDILNYVKNNDDSVDITEDNNRQIDYDYVINADDTITIKKYLGKSSTVKIPSKIDGKNVTAIGDLAFEGNKYLKCIYITNGINKIGYNAFKDCTALKMVDIAGTVSDVHSDTFKNCKNIEFLNLREGIKNIDSYAFVDMKNLEMVSIPKSIIQIGERAFGFYANNDNDKYNYSYLYCDSFTIGVYKNSAGEEYADKFGISNKYYEGDTIYKLRAINNHEAEIAFCTNTKTLMVIPENLGGYSITGIEEAAFFDDENIETVIFPNTLTDINAESFYYCKNLKKIYIPDSVTKIGELAFSDCEKLERVNIPDSNVHIEYDAFERTKIMMKQGDKFVYIDNWLFYNPNNTDWGNDSKDFTVKEGTIGVNVAFCKTDGDYSTLKLPASLKYFNVFSDMNYIDPLIEPIKFKNIEVDSKNLYFSSKDGVLFNKDKTKLILYPNNNKRKNYSIPKSVKSIEKRAFWCCGELTSVTIPKSVKSIGYRALGYINMEFEGEEILIDNFTIRCYKGTAGEKYAEENGFCSVKIDKLHNKMTTTKKCDKIVLMKKPTQTKDYYQKNAEESGFECEVID